MTTILTTNSKGKTIVVLTLSKPHKQFQPKKKISLEINLILTRRLATPEVQTDCASLSKSLANAMQRTYPNK